MDYLEMLQPGYWVQLNKPEVWPQLVLDLFTALAALFAVWLAYRYAQKSNRRQQLTGMRLDRLQREVNALEAVWPLLAYLAPTDNKNAIRVVRTGKSKDIPKQYFARFENLQYFLTDGIQHVFYGKYAGLYLADETKILIYRAKSSLYGYYYSLKMEREENESKELHPIGNIKLAEAIEEHYDKLHKHLREELEMRYQKMQKLVENHDLK